MLPASFAQRTIIGEPMRPLAMLVLSVSMLLGCTSEPAESGRDVGASGAGGAAGATARTPPSCVGPGYASPDDVSHVVSELVGRLVRLDGQPPARTLALLCGLDLCVYGATDDEGDIVLCDGSSSQVCTNGIGSTEPIKRPALKYGDGLSYVKLAQLLSTETNTYDLGAIAIAELPPFDAGEPLAAGAEATSAGVTVTVGDGGAIEIDLLTYVTDAEQRFRAVAIPIADAPPAVDPELGFEIVIGTAPGETHFCPEAALQVPNSAGWAPDSAVEIWLHGTDPSQDWAPYGGWAKISDARVTSDGTAVVSVAGGGIPVLGVFGLRKR